MCGCVQARSTVTTQVTLAQLDNYGPWTVTPEPRREPDLQTLQARLYADLVQLVGAKDGYVFFGRFDNMVAITNGLTRDDHQRIQSSIGNRYPVTVSFGIGTGDSPADALETATDRLQQAGSAQDGDRTEILDGTPLAEADRTADDVRIAHFDVVDATGTYTDQLDAYETFLAIKRGIFALEQYMYDRHGALTFFVGGDNAISVVPSLTDREYEEAIAHVSNVADAELQVGVGSGATAVDAGMIAKHALEVCRENGTRIQRAGQPVPGD